LAASAKYEIIEAPLSYVLKNVNLKLYAGEKLAIVGESGSGKTTLIKLVCRLYQRQAADF
jgi:ATP-binding cassette subfamily B protein